MKIKKFDRFKTYRMFQNNFWFDGVMWIDSLCVEAIQKEIHIKIGNSVLESGIELPSFRSFVSNNVKRDVVSEIQRCLAVKFGGTI